MIDNMIMGGFRFLPPVSVPISLFPFQIPYQCRFFEDNDNIAYVDLRS